MTDTGTIIAKIREVCTELTKQLTSLIVTIRIVLSLPFALIGLVCVTLTDFVSGRDFLIGREFISWEPKK